MKKLCYLMSVCILFVLCSCGEVEMSRDEIDTLSKVNDFIEQIDDFSDMENVTQSEIDKLFKEYNSFSAEDKEKITNYDKLEKYKGVNIDAVKDVESKIKAISDKSSFSDINSIYETYESLNDNEQNLIDITTVQERRQLTDLEKATVSACQYIKESLKNSSSFELISAKAINDIGKTSNYYLVNIKYSATNSFGAKIDDTSFQTISDEFKNPWYPLAMLNGDYSVALECTPFIQYYLTNEQEPKDIDCDKILYYIDVEIE